MTMITKHHFHMNESLTLAATRQMQEDRLVQQMAYLKQHSEFYQQKFAEAGVEFDDIHNIEDLALVPFTIKQELRDSLAAKPPFGMHLAAPIEQIVQVQSSSGTTGSPAYVGLTRHDVTAWSDMIARGVFACGIRPGDFVLHAFALSKGFVGGIPILQGLQYMDAIDIPVGADGGLGRLLRAAADVRPRAIIGTPFFIQHLGESAPELIGCEANTLGVERLVVGGEPGGGIPSVRASLEATWGAKVCEMMGGTDLGSIYWGECDEQRGMHMNCPDYMITELIDWDTGQVLPWEAGVKGELVYTALGREASPLVRFRSADRVEVLGTECACGRTGPRIRCLGRSDDMLIVRGVNVFPSAIQDIVAAMDPRRTNGVMRVWADFPGHSTQANLKVFVERQESADTAGDATLKRHIQDNILNSLAVKTDVKIVAPGTFEPPGVKKIALVIRELPDGLSH
ncbi:MAG: hypothetical protein ABJM11_06280 [Marinobacter sp.]|uniref:phenylacetate--CoA ligase family protein n=1 Tax=Marinobacter sp. TaxID=50741 RepID=UPI0032984C31